MQPSETVTHEDVANLLQQWEPEFRSYTVAEERIQLYLDRALNPDPVGSGRIDVGTPPDATSCDVVVDDDIGVNVYRSFTKQEFENFRALLENCEQDYVVMYAYDLPDGDSSRDQWRYTRSKYRGNVGDVEDVRFIHYVPDEGPDRNWLRELLEYPEALLFGLLSVAVGIALIVGTATGGQSIVGGPVVTGLVSLVLVVLLILLWGMQQ